MTHAQQSSRVERHKTAYRVQSLLASVMTAIAAAAILYIIFAFWLVPVRVAGDSMAPTLQNGQVVLVDRAAKFIRTPKRGDIAAFYDPATGGLLLRRITALEGESIDLKDGLVYIDGCPLDESDYLPSDMPMADSAPTVVPQGTVFVLADARNYNGDSRDAVIGCIRYEEIQGIVRFRIHPMDALAWFR